ncbi:MAG: hypothetical protein ACRDJN_12855, partial [Chloroflexota bacterium]
MMAARREGRTEQGRTEQGRTAPGAARRDRREWMTLAEAAALVGVQPVTLRRAALVGTLVAQRSGKVWLTTEPDVRAWLRAARHRPGPRPGE